MHMKVHTILKTETLFFELEKIHHNFRQELKTKIFKKCR